MGSKHRKGPPHLLCFNQLEGMRSRRRDNSYQVSQEALSQAVRKSRTSSSQDSPHLKARDPIPAAHPEHERRLAGEGLRPVSATLAYSDGNQG